MNPFDLFATEGGLLLDFDGPVASVFAVVTVREAADNLTVRAGSKWAPDPFDILRGALDNPEHWGDPETIAAELETVETRAMRSAPPAPGGLEVIRRWWGRPLGIVSNNAASPIKNWLCRQDVATPVHYVQGRTLHRLKPDPWPLLQAARRLGVSPAHCTFVGDALSDGVAAKAAGMRFVGLALVEGRKAEFIEQGVATAVVSSMTDLLGPVERHRQPSKPLQAALN